VKVTELFLAMSVAITSPVVTSKAAIRLAVPWRTYSKSWRGPPGGRRHGRRPALLGLDDVFSSMEYTTAFSGGDK
jgi:hypothetical protein